MKTSEQLRSELRAIDHKSYPAYKSLGGSWSFGRYTLNIDHVQGDPFAAPSQLSVTVGAREAGFPAGRWQQPAAVCRPGGAVFPPGQGLRQKRRSGGKPPRPGDFDPHRLPGEGGGNHPAV